MRVRLPFQLDSTRPSLIATDANAMLMQGPDASVMKKILAKYASSHEK